MTESGPIDSVVLVKQVPDTHHVTGDAMTKDGTMNRGVLPAIFNPEDLHALEAALQIKEKFGGTVTVVTMGPPAACEVLRECLYRGADRAILITDRRAAASDTLEYARTRIGESDFVLPARAEMVIVAAAKGRSLGDIVPEMNAWVKREYRKGWQL